MPPTQIDPARFTDKTFSRKPTWADSVNDYRISIDGLAAGRIMQANKIADFTIVQSEGMTVDVQKQCVI